MNKKGYNYAIKWYDLRQYTIRDLVNKNLIRFKVIKSNLNPIGSITKPLNIIKFKGSYQKLAISYSFQLPIALVKWFFSRPRSFIAWSY